MKPIFRNDDSCPKSILITTLFPRTLNSIKQNLTQKLTASLYFSEPGNSLFQILDRQK